MWPGNSACMLVPNSSVNFVLPQGPLMVACICCTCYGSNLCHTRYTVPAACMRAACMRAACLRAADMPAAHMPAAAGSFQNVKM